MIKKYQGFQWIFVNKAPNLGKNTNHHFLINAEYLYDSTDKGIIKNNTIKTYSQLKCLCIFLILHFLFNMFQRIINILDSK